MLSVFFNEISGFGVTLKRQVEQLKQASDATQRAVARNREAAHEASQHAADVGREMLALREESAGPVQQIRLTTPSGAERTTRMTASSRI